MSAGLTDFEQRRADLLQRCAQQREQLCSEISYIEAQLGGVQRGIQIAQRLTTLPGLLVSGSILTMLAIAGRGRTLQIISTGLALWAGIRQIMPADFGSRARQPDPRN
jgi:hypothetical protein